MNYPHDPFSNRRWGRKLSVTGINPLIEMPRGGKLLQVLFEQPASRRVMPMFVVKRAMSNSCVCRAHEFRRPMKERGSTDRT